MSAPYYADDLVTLWLGDCREVTDWLSADVLVTDPPYGRKYQPHREPRRGIVHNPDRIAGDQDTTARDDALTAWGDRWATPPAGQPLRFTHTTCGKVTTPTVCCSECGDALTTGTTTPSPGPGGRTAPGTALIATVLTQ